MSITAPQSSSAAFSESNEEVQEEFYPISCKRCKTNHKKCDKKLPACSYCSTRGITCCYEPRKVRKSSSSDDSNKRKKRKISSEWKAIIPSDDTILIEFYFDVLANGLPILSREKFNYFIMNGLEECLHSSSSLLNHGGDEIEFELLQFNSMMIESQVELKGLFVWYLSLLTLYYQFNAKSELAESTVELCEKHVQKFSFQCFNNMYYVAGCFALGLYLRASSDHQQEKTRFYRHYADLYFLKKKEVEIVDAFERNFHQSYLFLNYVMENEYIGDFTSLIQALPNFCKILPGKSIQDFVMPEIWNYLENSQLDSSNYMIFKHLLDGIVAFANQLKMSIVIDTTIQNQSSISKNYMELDNLVRNIIGEGFKLMFFMKIPQISEEIIELTALNITLQTENEIFKYVYPFTDVGIRKACEYHLMVCKQIEENKRTRKSSIQTPSGRNISFDNFELLEKDLKALESLGNRFKNVYKTNKQLMEECRKISKRQNNITDMSVSGISNTNIDYLQSCTQWNQENQENLLSSIIEFINSISNDNNEQATTLDESILDLHCNEE